MELMYCLAKKQKNRLTIINFKIYSGLLIEPQQQESSRSVQTSSSNQGRLLDSASFKERQSGQYYKPSLALLTGLAPTIVLSL